MTEETFKLYVQAGQQLSSASNTNKKGYKEAIATYKKLHDMNSNQVCLLSIIGVLYGEMHQFLEREKYLTEFRKGIENKIGDLEINIESCVYVARDSNQMGNYEDEITWLNQALYLAPENMDVSHIQNKLMQATLCEQIEFNFEELEGNDSISEISDYLVQIRTKLIQLAKFYVDQDMEYNYPVIDMMERLQDKLQQHQLGNEENEDHLLFLFYFGKCYFKQGYYDKVRKIFKIVSKYCDPEMKEKTKEILDNPKVKLYNV